MFGLWQDMQAPMGGTGHLPEAGGLLDQHAPTMQAAGVLSEAMAWLRERFPRAHPKAHAKGGR